RLAAGADLALRERRWCDRGIEAGMLDRDADHRRGRRAIGGPVIWTSLQVLEDSAEISTRDWEMLLLPLAGSCSVTCGTQTIELQGGVDASAGPTDFAYLPRDSTVRIEGQGRFALPGARATKNLPFRYGSVSDVAIELRGAGNCSRLIRNFCMAATFE